MIETAFLIGLTDGVTTLPGLFYFILVNNVCYLSPLYGITLMKVILKGQVK